MDSNSANKGNYVPEVIDKINRWIHVIKNPKYWVQLIVILIVIAFGFLYINHPDVTIAVNYTFTDIINRISGKGIINVRTNIKGSTVTLIDLNSNEFVDVMQPINDLDHTITINEGFYKIIASSPGYTDAVEAIGLDNGHRLSRTLQLQKSSRLIVKVMPENADIKIAKEGDGSTSAYGKYNRNNPIEAGKYKIRVSCDGFVTETISVDIGDSDTVDKVIQLKEKPKLRVISTPSNATIVLEYPDNSQHKIYNSQTTTIDPGDYQLTVTSNKHYSVNRLIQLVAGDIKLLDVVLRKKPKLTVTTTPKDAIITLRNNAAGKEIKIYSDETIILEGGDYTVTVSADGYFDTKRDLKLIQDDDKSLAVSLSKKDNIVIRTGQTLKIPPGTTLHSDFIEIEAGGVLDISGQSGDVSVLHANDDIRIDGTIKCRVHHNWGRFPVLSPNGDHLEYVIGQSEGGPGGKAGHILNDGGNGGAGTNGWGGGGGGGSCEQSGVGGGGEGGVDHQKGIKGGQNAWEPGNDGNLPGKRIGGDCDAGGCGGGSGGGGGGRCIDRSEPKKFCFLGGNGGDGGEKGAHGGGLLLYAAGRLYGHGTIDLSGSAGCRGRDGVNGGPCPGAVNDKGSAGGGGGGWRRGRWIGRYSLALFWKG